jgi:hypothetical protein
MHVVKYANVISFINTKKYLKTKNLNKIFNFVSNFSIVVTHVYKYSLIFNIEKMSFGKRFKK